MGLDVLAFGFGALLLLVGIFGGGFEIKELKLPKVTWLPRLATGFFGFMFIMVGVSVHEPKSQPQQSISPAVPDVSVRRLAEPLPVPPTLPAAVAPAPQLVMDPPPALPPTFAGVTGKARLEWRVGDDSYTAIVNTWGAAGVADVVWSSPTNGRAVIRQDLVLVSRDIGWLYVGSNPRVSDSEPAADYAPDAFRLGRVGEAWTFVDTCDAQGECSAVSTTALD